MFVGGTGVSVMAGVEVSMGGMGVSVPGATVGVAAWMLQASIANIRMKRALISLRDMLFSLLGWSYGMTGVQVAPLSVVRKSCERSFSSRLVRAQPTNALDPAGTNSTWWSFPLRSGLAGSAFQV